MIIYNKDIVIKRTYVCLNDITTFFGHNLKNKKYIIEMIIIFIEKSYIFNFQILIFKI